MITSRPVQSILIFWGMVLFTFLKASVCLAQDTGDGRDLTAVVLDGHLGFINTEGQMVIPPTFDSAGGGFNMLTFRNGLAVVKKDEKAGYINAKGQWVIKPVFLRAYDFSDQGLAQVEVQSGSGMIDRRGNWVIKPQFESLQSFGSHKFTGARQNKLWGVIDSKGNWLLKPMLSGISDFNKRGLAMMRLPNDSWRLADHTGQLIHNDTFDEYHLYSSRGLIAVRKNKLWGLMDDKGRILIKPSFNGNLTTFRDNSINARTKNHLDLPLFAHQGRHVLIGRNGQALKTTYEHSRGFTSRGLAAVKLKGLWGIVNLDGAWVIKPDYEAIGDFHPNMEAVPARLKGRWGWLKADGSWAVKPRFSELRYNKYADQYLAKEGEVWGGADGQGRLIQEPVFQSIKFESHRRGADIKHQGRWGHLDRRGNWRPGPGADIDFAENRHNLHQGNFKNRRSFFNHDGQIVATIGRRCGLEVLRDGAGQVSWPPDIERICASPELKRAYWSGSESVGDLSSALEQTVTAESRQQEELCSDIASPEYWDGLSEDDFQAAANKARGTLKLCLRNKLYDHYRSRSLTEEFIERANARLNRLDDEIKARRQQLLSPEQAVKNSFLSLLSLSYPTFNRPERPPTRLVIEGMNDLGPITYLGLTPDNKLLAVSDGFEMVMYEVSTRRELWRRSFVSPVNLLNNVIVFSPYIEMGGGEIEAFDALTGRQLAPNAGPGYESADIGPGGRYFSAGYNILVDTVNAAAFIDHGDDDVDIAAQMEKFDYEPGQWSSPNLYPHLVAHSGWFSPTLFRSGRYWLYAPDFKERGAPVDLIMYDLEAAAPIPLIFNGRPVNSADLRWRKQGERDFLYQSRQSDAGQAQPPIFWEAVFSPDGAWLALTDSGGNINFFSVSAEGGRHVGVLNRDTILDGRLVEDYELSAVIGQNDRRQPFCFFTSRTLRGNGPNNPDKQLLVSVDLERNSLVEFFPLHQPGRVADVLSLAVNGQTAAVGTSSGSIFFINLKNGLVSSIDTGGPEPVTALSYSEDGQKLAAGNTVGRILLIDEKGAKSWPSGQSRAITQVAVDNQGRSIWAASSPEVGSVMENKQAGLSYKKLMLLDVKSGQIKDYRYLRAPVNKLVYSEKRSRALVSTVYEGTTWGEGTPSDLKESYWAEGSAIIMAANALGFSPDGEVMALPEWESHDLSTRLYFPWQKQRLDIRNVEYTQSSSSMALCDSAFISDDQKLVLMQIESIDAGFRSDIYSTVSGFDILSVDEYDKRLDDGAFLNQGRLMITTSSDGLRMWDLTSGTSAKTILHWIFFTDGGLCGGG